MRNLAVSAIALGALLGSAFAGSTQAFDVATVQPGGPRTGNNGKNFFNIQGNDNGNFASFGVADFNGGLLRPTEGAADISNIVLKLYDAPASFSAAGNIRFWLTPNSEIDIQPGTSPLIFDSNFLPDGVGNQIPTLFDLGTGFYAPGTAGDEFVYSLTPNAAAKQLLLDRINDLDVIRLIITPDQNDVSATFRGINPTFPDNFPTLEADVEPVPEPATMLALGAGLAAFAARRRKKA